MNFPGITLLVKGGLGIADLFAVIFLLVVIKQVSSMNHIVHDSNDYAIIRTFTYLLLFAYISLFLITIAIL